MKYQTPTNKFKYTFKPKPISIHKGINKTKVIQQYLIAPDGHQGNKNGKHKHIKLFSLHAAEIM